MEWVGLLGGAGAALIGAITGAILSRRHDRERDLRQMRLPSYARFLEACRARDAARVKYVAFLHAVDSVRDEISAEAIAQVDHRESTTYRSIADDVHMALAELQIIASADVFACAVEALIDETDPLIGVTEARGELPAPPSTADEERHHEERAAALRAYVLACKQDLRPDLRRARFDLLTRRLRRRSRRETR